jgi:FOG: PKD repeat
MFGSGYDEWGFGMENGSFSKNETPIAYYWDLGDNVSSTLKNPIHQYMEPGVYPVVLTVMDQGGYFSESQTWTVVVEDTSDPVPEISVEGVVVSEELVLLTNQQVMFSALGTTDNLPLEELYFEWNWGDGEIQSGIGLYESSHSWIDGSAEGIVYTLSLLVSDGIHDVEHTIFIKILNRVPQQIYDSQLQTYTLTPLTLPSVFIDSDGMIVDYDWSFEEGVNLDGGGMTMTSDYSQTSSDEANPTVGWLTPGMKNISLTVTDDDGNSTFAILQVNVINQRPVAVFSRPADGNVDTTIHLH